MTCVLTSNWFIRTPMTAFPEKVGKYSIQGIERRETAGLVYIGHDPFIDNKSCNQSL